MKITLNSSDGLGDFVLRIPLLRSLLAGKHEVQLLMRPPASSLAVDVFPEIRVHHLVDDPYVTQVRLKQRPFRQDFRAVRTFDPDLYIAGLFQVNFFDEIWLGRMSKAIRSVGFLSESDAWFTATNTDPFKLAEKFTLSVPVSPSLPEVEKNATLAAAITGIIPAPIYPKLLASLNAREEASRIFARNGLRANDYLIVCAGGRKGLEGKDWGEDNWAAALSAIGHDSCLPLVFLGNLAEHPSIERIRGAIPSKVKTLSLADTSLSIPAALALVEMSAGYVGRDSGVMHLAAATGRKILALFGGSHWGRFLPSSGPAMVLTHNMPCQGCDGHCPLDRPHCIRDISLDAVLRAWKRLQEPDLSGVEVIELPCPSSLMAEVAEKASRRLAVVASWERRDRLDGQRTRNGIDHLASGVRHLARRFPV